MRPNSWPMSPLDCWATSCGAVYWMLGTRLLIKLGFRPDRNQNQLAFLGGKLFPPSFALSKDSQTLYEIK